MQCIYKKYIAIFINESWLYMTLFDELDESFQNENIVAFDFETATSFYSSACSLGVAIINSNGEIVKTVYKLIKPPGNRYDSKNIDIHGITPDDTKNAPTFNEVWENDFKEYFINANIAAHYAVFDINVLSSCLKTAHFSIPPCNIYCTCIAAKRAFKELANHKLPTICDKLNISLNHHNALDDAIACAKIAHTLRNISMTKMSWDVVQNFSTYKKEFHKKY